MKFFAAALLATLMLAPAAQAQRPNILWLIGEDFSPHLSCYGEKHVHTPNLDALAAAGVRYENAFATAPVCSASRSAFMTGMYQTTIGAHNHRSHRSDDFRLPDGVAVLTDHLRSAGYFTANIRKFPPALGIRGSGKTDWNFKHDPKPFDSDDWVALKSHQPFMAQVNFSETHRKFRGPRKADPAAVDIPPYYPDHPVIREDWARYLDDAMELDRKIGLVLKQLEADGLADSTVVIFIGDHGQAHVRGKQWCYDSGLRVPLIIHYPKALAAPKHYKAGSVDRRVVELIDLSATILAITGTPIPPRMQGQPFLTDLADAGDFTYAFGARDRCDETVFRIRTVRDARYRYIRNFYPERPFLQLNRYKEHSYPAIAVIRQLHAEGRLNEVQAALVADRRPAEELYDLHADPHETRNLVDSPDHAQVLERMRGELERWIETTNDQGRVAEDPKIVEYWDEQMRKAYEKKK